MSTISNPVDGTVVVGSAAYSSPLTIMNTGQVYGPAYGTGLYENGPAFSVTNYGSVLGGDGGITGIGGLGVDLRAGTFVDYGFISGGGGQYGGSGNGGSGGVGVSISVGGSLVLESGGTIDGGSGPHGEYVYRHSFGGAGVDLTGGTLTTAGTIVGGRGDGGGGAGVNAINATVTNTGTITGGGGGSYYGGTGGVGVALSGGTLITSGVISGVSAVHLGAIASTLIVEPGAVFNGQVAANATVNDVLELAGIQSGGTAITLGTEFAGFSTVDFAAGAAWRVNVGVSAAPSGGLTVGGFSMGDTIDVTNLTPTQVIAALNSTDNVLTSSDGTISLPDIAGDQLLLSGDGGSGTNIILAHDPITTTLTMGSGRYPSSLTITSTGAIAPTADGATGLISNVVGNSLTNYGSIRGGASVGGIGGVGVNFSAFGTIINNGSVMGGSGGSTGGVGIALSAGALTNNATIIGGTGGAGAAGGAGVYMTGGTLTNNKSISGGTAGFNAVGSAGVLIMGGTLNNSGSIIGSTGSAGGAGVNMSTGSLTNGGTIAGGTGGAGGIGGRGIGVYGGALTNNGNIIGGTGGSKAKGAAGVYQYGGTVTNNGSITGGLGGINGRGAAGVFLKSGTLTNNGTITGGAGSGTGRGWAGVYLNGGTAVTSGTISGGASGSPNGMTGAAVQFGAAASTLVIEPGAVFNGQLIANASVNDVLELVGTQSGGAAIGLGSQFTGFSQLDFASGAAWKVNVGAGAAPTTGMTLEGFAIGNTIDITNLTPTQVASGFNPTTNFLSAAGDGALNFVGTFANEYFAFNSDGSGGTAITLVKGSGISTILTKTVVLGNTTYLSPLIITSTGGVTPTTGGAIAVNCSVSGKALTNDGSIQGGAAGTGGSSSGGVGVNFKAADTLINNGAIAGGSGGSGTATGGHGGAGVYSAGGTVTNNGAVRGGSGGAASGKGGVGGAGVFLSGGTLTNAGNISGGRGGAGGNVGGAAGAGVYLNGGTLTNAGILSGGTGGSGTVNGAGGNAVQFGTVASTLSIDPGAVFNGQVAGNGAVNDVLALTGIQSAGTAITLGTQFTGFSTLDFAPGSDWHVNVGTGAAPATGLTVDGFAIGDTIDITNLAPNALVTDFNAVTNVLTSASDGTLKFAGISGEQFLFSSDGGGGADIVLAHNPITTTITLGGGVYPGSLVITATGAVAPIIAGATGVISNVVGTSLTSFGSIHGGASVSGNGGIGVNLAAIGTVSNYGGITGGNGGRAGGAGVSLAAGTMTNETNGTILGGVGGYHANGGVGANLTGGFLTNLGSIVGGTGGFAKDGAAGVLLNGGTLVTNGSITGGTGGGGGVAGAAVKFGAVASTLIVEPGAAFNGQVIANSAVNDVLELSGVQSSNTAITLGTQFTNFSTLAFAVGAAGTVDATTAALSVPHIFAINGFKLGDTLDITNLAAKGALASFNSTTDVLTITKGTTTTIRLQFDNAFTGDHLVIKGDGQGGANVSLAAGAAVTLATLAHDVSNFVGNEPAPARDPFMLAAASGRMVITTTADSTAFFAVHGASQAFHDYGGASHSLIDSALDHIVGGAFR